MITWHNSERVKVQSRPTKVLSCASLRSPQRVQSNHPAFAVGLTCNSPHGTECPLAGLPSNVGTQAVANEVDVVKRVAKLRLLKG